MSPSKRPPAVVAELGRPETPEETAERKAENSRNHRNRQTVNNLVFSLIATVAVVALIVLFVPRGQPAGAPAVDYASIAGQAQGAEPDALLTPALPSGWKSNAAELRTKTPDGVDAWYIGLITPSKEYIGIMQGFKANDSWLATQVDRSLVSSTKTACGLRWDVYDNRNSGQDNGNVDYALATKAGSSTVVVFGTAQNQEFDTVTNALCDQLGTLGAGK
ncbi:DUF4245 domain-containing protein [Diaminobutyricibacter tongyongensis]|uniref:DUF4245 domain-containing protein n=1 Tax=Leifsonia tongyongensis TaxID=1268043 RepID=A0A6L9Y136_9MICO|nr:DUF4245 domain-containing protein [Diaminobutyricibacter tongyongensis]NEN07235.1 DUF4245 domain-containing protein [Diaminobutyricibacter tongyongensis]